MLALLAILGLAGGAVVLMVRHMPYPALSSYRTVAPLIREQVR